MPVHSSAKSRSRSGRSSFTCPIVAAAMLVAIDGPAGAGKSTVARAVARRARLHLPRLRGAVPRRGAVGRERSERPATSASTATACCSTARTSARRSARRRSPRRPRGGRPTRPCARALLDKQRALIASGDWVAEGRDIGTVVAPDAELKVWLTADEDERARRRGVAGATRSASATSATRAASTRRWSPPPTPSRSTPPGWASTTSWRGSWRSWGEDAVKVAVVGYPERRQVLARQPPDRLALGGRPRARGHHARPQRDRLRVERPALRPDRHRRHGLPRRRPDRRLDPRAGPGRAQRRGGGDLRRRRARRAPARRRGARRPPAPLEAPRSSSPPTRSTRWATWRWPPTSTRSASATRSRSRPRRGSTSATCSTA